MKNVVIVLMIAIVASLGSGLFYLTGKNHNPEKFQRALRWRLIFSAALVLFLVVSYFAGWLEE